MNRPPGRLSRPGGRLHWTAPGSVTAAILLVLIVGMFVMTLWTIGPQDAGGLGANLAVAAVFLPAIVAAEQFRVRLPGRARTAPLVTALGVAMAFAADRPGGPITYSAGGCVLAVGLALAIGVIPRHVRSVSDPLTDALDVSVRLFSVAVAALAWRYPLPWLDGVSLMERSRAWPSVQQAGVLIVIGFLAVIAGTPLMAARRAALERMRWSQATRDEAALTMGLGLAIAATATMIVACLPVLDLAAVPLFMLPMLFTQTAVRRQSMIRETYRQTVTALSSMPEVTGIIPRGHARDVARLSVGVGRRLGMSEREVNDLEFAALLHDIGQVTLRYPIPGGATVQAAPVDQQRIADDGAAIVRETGVLGSVADIVATQASPYRRVLESQERLPIGGRILKVTNAYADYLQVHVDAGEPLEQCRAAAIERIYLGLGYQFDPVVVSALERVLAQET